MADRVTSDLDIYRTANALINQHGDMDAEMHAAMRADELLEAGDMDGRRVWLRVLEAVREWTARNRQGKGRRFTEFKSMSAFDRITSASPQQRTFLV